MNFPEIFFASIIVFGAMLIRGFAGFGAGLIMTPLLIFVFDIKTVVIVASIIEVVSGSFLTFRARKFIQKDALPILLLSSFVGITAGTHFLVSLKGVILKGIFGVVVVGFALRMLFFTEKMTGTHRWPRSIALVAGLLGGVLGGVFGTGGPPIVVYLNHELERKEALRATLMLYFLVTDAFRLMNYTYSGLLTSSIIELCALLVPASLLGAYIGTELHIKVSERFFRKAIGAILLATGASLSIFSILGY